MSARRRFGIASLLMVGALLVSACEDDSWIAIFYPDGNDLVRFEVLGEYSTLDLCRFAVSARATTLGVQSTSDYECGKNCRRETSYRLTCEATEE